MKHPKTRDHAPRAALPSSLSERSELALEHVDALSRHLRIPVEIDTTGWLRRGVELRYSLASDRSVHPTSVRVASSATFHELVADGGILARCARYNRALDALRALRVRAESLLQRGHTPHEPGSAIWSAQQELSNLDATIARRQTARMGHGVATLEILGFEAAFLERYNQHLAATVDTAERAERRRLGERDTVELLPGPSATG